jgi:hypothetical protein
MAGRRLGRLESRVEECIEGYRGRVWLLLFILDVPRGRLLNEIEFWFRFAYSISMFRMVWSFIRKLLIT